MAQRSNSEGFNAWLFGDRARVDPQVISNFSGGQKKDFASIGKYLEGQVGKRYNPTSLEQGQRAWYQNYVPWATSEVNSIYDPSNISSYFGQAYKDWDRKAKGIVGEQYAGNYWGSGRMNAQRDSLMSVLGQEQGALNTNELARQKALDQQLSRAPEMAINEAELGRKFEDPLYNPVLDPAYKYLTVKPNSSNVNIQAPMQGAIGDILKWAARIALYNAGSVGGGEGAGAASGGGGVLADTGIGQGAMDWTGVSDMAGYSPMSNYNYMPNWGTQSPSWYSQMGNSMGNYWQNAGRAAALRTVR